MGNWVTLPSLAHALQPNARNAVTYRFSIHIISASLSATYELKIRYPLTPFKEKKKATKKKTATNFNFDILSYV